MTEIDVAEPSDILEGEVDLPDESDFRPINEIGGGEIVETKKSKPVRSEIGRTVERKRSSKPRAPRKKKQDPEENTPSLMDKVIEAKEQAAIARAQLQYMAQSMAKKVRKPRVAKPKENVQITESAKPVEPVRTVDKPVEPVKSTVETVIEKAPPKSSGLVYLRF